MESCSWCGRMNPAEIANCLKCGHDAHRPRSECDCYQCTAFPASVTAAARRKAEAKE